MTDQQWQTLIKIINGEQAEPMPVGFIIDCPWLPNWYGVRILDYFTNDELWFKANLKAIQDFPDIMFLPGFWSEFGMCTEPSAFGSCCTFPADEFPHANKILRTAEDIDSLRLPDPRKDGLLPFMLNRLKLNQGKIEAAGHKIRFAVARGPLNVASYLMGSTEFLTLMMLKPEKADLLVKKVTHFLKDWLQVQMETFPSIDGIFLLDDIIGFLGEMEFRTFGLPYFKELYSLPVSVKFLHNDASCRASAPLLPEMGVNLFNMGFEITLNELKELTGNRVTLLGNLPPRDVLACATPKEVESKTREMARTLTKKSRVILSCGGGMPPKVSSENLNAFLRGVCT